MVSVRLLLLMIFGISITSWAAESDKVVSVTCQGSTFTITRSDASAATYINYRTLDGSAVGGKNFTPQAGRLYFNKGEFSKSIEIKEIDPGESIFAFGNTDREYYFEAWNSFCDPVIAKKTISNRYSYTYHNAGERSKLLTSYFKWTDDRRDKFGCYLSDMVTYDEERYRRATGQGWYYKFRIEFHTRYINDGWMNAWMYLGGSQVHHFEYEDAGTANRYEPWWYLTETCSSNRYLSTEWENHGSGDDYTHVDNLYVKCFYIDEQAPSPKMLQCNTIYPYATGDELYVSVCYDEIVNFTQTQASYIIYSNIGDLQYVSGAGTNVLSFKTTLSSETEVSKLEITGSNFSVKDIAGRVQNSLKITNNDFKYKPKYLPSTSKANATPDKWKRENKLSWSNDKTKNVDGIWHVYRYKTAEGPSNLSDYPYPLLNSETDGKRATYIDNSDDLLYDIDYTYLLQFVPKTWNDLTRLFLDRYIIVQSIISRSFLIDLKIKSYDDHIALEWKSDEFQDSKAHEYKIYRKEGSDGKFVELTKVSSSVTTYDDYKVSSGCATYFYKVVVSSLFPDEDHPSGLEYSSDSTLSGQLTTQSQVLSLEATKGTYAGTVKLNWDAQQTGTSETKYVVYRRDLNSTDSWVKLYTTSGTATVYAFDDNTALPGKYYEYKVASSYICSTTGLETEPVEVKDDGFCRALGVISGRVAYGTGTAVSGVKVSVEKNSDNEIQQFYSLRVDGASQGIELPLTEKQGDEYFNNPWSIQMYVRPDASITDANRKAVDTIPLIQSYHNFGLYLTPNNSNEYYVSVAGPYKDSIKIENTPLLIKADKFSHMTFSYNGKNQLTVRITDEYGNITTTINKIDSINFVKFNDTTDINPLRFGNSVNSTEIFQGYLDEVRVFANKELTDDEILSNYNRTLSGTESKLVLYWPMDEGIQNQKKAYDYSKTSGVTNNNHGTIFVGSKTTSMQIPTKDQLSIFGVTDTMGNYTINGIPFEGDGTTYRITPVYGIHKFSPQYATRFVSASSLVYSGVDFEDVSAFPVKGTVTYYNTNYPVEGANIYVDGTVCSKDGELIATDANGEFTVSVPIGDHHIQVKKQENGITHTFVKNGRFPTNSLEEHTFDSELSGLTFFDSTFVTLTGRVAGGVPESKKPHGLGAGNATIGKATITLSAGEKPQFNLDPAQKRTFANPSKYVNSVTTTGKYDDGEKARIITIHTDPVTGEFAVSLPPVDYKVKSVKVDNNPEVTFSTDNIEMIQFGSKTMAEKEDTLVTESDSAFFKYLYALDLIYRSNPVLEVTSADNKSGAFGDEKYVYKDFAKDTKDTIALFNTVNDSIKYTFGYPLYTQLNEYSYNLYGYEPYENKDSDVVLTKIPLTGAEITIANDMGATIVAGSDGKDEEGNAFSDGDVIQTGVGALTLNEEGKTTYKFQASYPNIVEPYTLGMNITYNYEGATYQWDQNGLFKGIVLGGLQSGNNFVTGGPDKVSFVLRDPPGSASSAYLEKGTSFSHTYHKSKAFDSQNEIKTTTHLGTRMAAGTGLGFVVISEVETKGDLIVGTEINGSYTDEHSYTTTTTTTETISTSDGSDYVGADGDVFIGAGTNYIFGMERTVAPRPTSNGSYSIQMKEELGIGQSFTTAFKYSQNYVENTLIPNYEKIRNSIFITDVPEEEYNESYPNRTDAPIYITKMSKDDERLGARNTDKEVWGDKASKDEDHGPSYIMIVPDKKKTYSDTIVWCNAQIESWKSQLENNEKMKVKAIASGSPIINHSFDSGTSIEHSVETCNDTTETTTSHAEAYLVVGTEFGVAINRFGVGVEVELKEGYQQDWGNDTTMSHCTNVGYVLAEEDGDALTVDVYEAGDGFGPIFYTRAGQTTCPYEDEVKTKYFEPGKHVISEKTMQVEMPRITVENPFATDIPSGSVANYTLNLDNLSETGDDVWFIMRVLDETNPNGAALSIDGVPFATDRQILVYAMETTHKNLQIKQSRMDIMKYDSIAVVLSSSCQDDIADTIYLSAEFVPSCSPLTLQIDDRTMNNSTGDTLQLVIKDFEKDYLNFNEIRLQYKGERDNDWNLAEKLMVEDLEGSRQVVSFPMSSNLFNDQTYQFRAISVCAKGASDIITNESETIDLIKDMARPQVLGIPNPSDGILDAGDEISVTYNEDIRNSLLSNTDNFIVEAVLNDAEVDHNVALKMDSTSKYAAATEASIVLANKGFSIDMWVNLSSGGTLLNHSSKDENFTVSVSNEGKLTVNIDGKKVTSSGKIPFNKWCFLTLCCSVDNDSSSVSSLVAYDAEQKSLLINKKLPKYGATGTLSFGKKIRGAISEVALWGTDRSNTLAQSQMHFTKVPSTENLIGYWKFSEGHGKVAKDIARSRNMVLANDSWYLNNTNYAVNLDGENHLSLDITRSTALSSDDYMMEMWFRGKNQKNATLWSANTKVALKFNADGYLTLLTDSVENLLSTNNYLDNAWHHVAMNVLRNGTTTIYMDGSIVKQIASSKVPALQAPELTIGAQRYCSSYATYDYTDYFKGDVDEVRYWLATFNAKAIDQNRYIRLKGDEAGLEAYYPFEKTVYDAGIAKSELTLTDMSENKVGDAKGSSSKAGSAPALQPKPNMSKLSYNFVASERTIVISLNENPSRLEGTTVNFTVKNVRDENNNFSLPVTWSAYVNQNRLIWGDDAISLEKNTEDEASFNVSVVNQGATTESWSISNLPSWLTASKNSGSLSALKSETIEFQISNAVPTGSYEETIYLVGNEGINVPFTLNLKVNAGKPNWNVDPSQFENSMSVIAQLKLDDNYSTDTEDLVAAFINGTCVGVASPKYYSRYDAYFVSLDIYGNSTDANKKVVFKAWDASTGVTYPTLSTSSNIKFSSNKLYGSMAEPIILSSNKLQEQNLDLKKGWNWISLNVKPSNDSINAVFGDIANKTNVLKSKTNFSQSNGDEFSGALKTVKIGSMYKVQMNTATDYQVAGDAIDASKESVTIKSGWNWIGFNSTAIMSLNEAFADLNPVDGDMVKGQSGFAYYEGYEWVGTLNALTPGKGYMFKSVASEKRTFKYPAKSSSLRSLISKNTTTETVYKTVNETAYSGNMTIVAVVKDGHDVLNDVQIGIFDAKDKCRAAAATDDNSLAFLTVMGGESADALTIKVIYNGFEYVLDQDLVYADDATLGTLSNPYIIQLNPVDANSDVLNGSISVYPTLVETSLNVKAESLNVTSYSISDISGRIMMGEETNSSEFTINVSSLSQGAYVLMMETEMGTVIKRFTKK